MAGCQRRKLLNGSSKHERCSSEVPRMRKKHARRAEDCFNSKSHVTLEWDAKKKRVIATKEQIGIGWRSLRPFFDSLPCGREILADTFDIPREIFDLNNLEEVLSQEVWQTCLSESERKYLMQFLPVEAEVQQIVKPLFAGDNFQFGNPLLQWGTSLRSGHMHPDAVVARERRLKAEKKAYYADLWKYHNDIIGCLLKLKDNWESCNNYEAVSGKIWRSKEDIKRTLSSSNGFVVEQGVAASSESSSWVADERTDNCNSVILKGGKLHKRMKKKAIEKDWGQTFNSPDDDLDSDLTAMNGDKTWNTTALSNDVAKYMSCIMISKKQHEIAKNMEKSGDSIHSKSLEPLLGDLQNYQIQPYEVFLEEERKKLNEHWLSVAKDLPAIYAAWRNHQLNKDHMIMSLRQELKEKLDFVMEEMEETSEEEVSDLKHEEALANSSKENEDIDESTLAWHVDNNDDGTGGLDVHTNDEDYKRDSQHYHSEQEASENYGEVEVNSDDPIVSPSLDLRGFSTRKNTSTMDENINSASSPVSAVDLRGQVTRNNASIMEENANPGDDSLCNLSLELPSHDQLLKEVLPLGGNHNNGFDSLDFEFQNSQVTSKPENALQLEIRSPFSAELGHMNIVNSRGVTLTSGGLKSQKNQITFRPEDSRQPHVSAYSPRLGATNMIISHGVPLASGGLETQSNQIMLNALKPEAVSVYSAMSGPTNVITSHGGPLPSTGFEAQRNQITLKCEDDRKPDGVSYSATSGPTNMIASHGVPLASSGLGGHMNQITLEPDDAQQPINVLAYSTRLGPTSMITSHGVPIASAGIEVPRNQITLKLQDARQPGDVSAYSARLAPNSMITSHGVPIASDAIAVQRNPVTLKSQDARQPGDVSAYLARLGPTNMMKNHGVPLTSNSDLWQQVSILHSGYNSAAGFSNSCTNELALPETLIHTEHPGQWNNVGCSLPRDVELLQEQTNRGTVKHYPEQDQNDLLQSIFKGQGVISYNHEQKYAGLNFQQSNSMLMGKSRFPSHFQDQQRLPLPIEQGHKAGHANYMQQNLMDNSTSNLGSFPQQGQEQLLPPNIDWPMNSGHFPESLACSIPGGDLSSQNWFAGERYVLGGWTASDASCAPTESLGNLNQSLYGVLSRCDQLRSTTPYGTIGSAEQFIPARSYDMVGGRNISRISNVLPHSVQSPVTNTLVSNDTGWINLPLQQNPSLNDAMGKPFMGSWDQ